MTKRISLLCALLLAGLFLLLAQASAETVYTDIEEAGAYVRGCMVARQTEIALRYDLGASTGITETARSIREAARAHTGTAFEGDYLRWSLSESRFKVAGTATGTVYTITYFFSYRTTAEQEAWVAQAMDDFLDGLPLGDMTEREKAAVSPPAAARGRARRHPKPALQPTKTESPKRRTRR